MKPISWFFISYQDSYFVFKGFLALSFKDQFAPVIVSSFCFSVRFISCISLLYLNISDMFVLLFV